MSAALEYDGGAVSFSDLVPVRPGELAVLGPVPCQGCGGDVVFTLPDPPLSFLGSWRRAAFHHGRGRLMVTTMAHRCAATWPVAP